MPKLPNALKIRSQTLKARANMSKAKILHHREEVRKIKDELKQIHGSPVSQLEQLTKEIK